jgi:hypothetical protein
MRLTNKTVSDGPHVAMLCRGDRIKMKRKPDLLWVLAIIFGLGVVTTGYTQVLLDRNSQIVENTRQD